MTTFQPVLFKNLIGLRWDFTGIDPLFAAALVIGAAIAVVILFRRIR